MLLGLIRERLVSQLSHAGYLGAELAKAESALRLGLRYAQDRPLRSDAEGETPPVDGAPARPRITVPRDAEHLALAPAGSAVQVALRIREVPERGSLVCTLLEPAEPRSGPRSFRATSTPVRVRWNEATRIAMGGPEDLTGGAVLRVHGELRQPGQVIADAIAVLTSVATILPSGG
jgi:hypothetical protein